jgi:aspartate aminotransferase
MDLISNRLSRFQPSLTVKISQKAREMRKNGVDVISLSSGEPDFDTPDHIKNFAIQAINDGFTKYTPVDGTDELKEAIVKKFKNENNITFENENISVAGGGKHIIYNLFMSSINKNDEVIIPSPYWVSYPDIVRLCGGKPVVCETTFEKGFKITADELEKKITNKTKWFIINSPSNPTGAVYSAQELKKISELLIKYPNIQILSDDIYEHVLYGDMKFTNILNVEPNLYKRTFIVNGVSKVFSMTGWRIGYGAGDKSFIKSMSKIQSQCTTNPCSISQMAAMFALQNDKKFLEDWLKKFNERKNFLINFFNSMEGLKAFKPDGAFYLYVSCEGLINKKYGTNKIINDFDFANFLLNEANVAIVPGQAFGKSPFFRLSYATSLNELEIACDRIKKSLKLLS